MLVFACSPHAGGATDRLAQAAIAGASPARPMAIIVRDYAVAPCRGCQACAAADCVLQPDGADFLFDQLASSDRVIFVSPIYFYALPGQFKLFIDRSQKFWACGQPVPRRQPKKAAVLLAAGRRRGEKLFQGALLTLKWFLKPFGYEIAAQRLLTGLDFAPPDLGCAFELGHEVASWGQQG